MEVDRCRDLRARFPAYVTDGGDPKLSERIRLHLAGGCVACAAEIDRLDAAFYAIGRAFQPVAPGDGASAAMASAVTRRHQEKPEEPILFAEHDRTRLAWWLVALFALALFAAGWWGRTQQEEMRTASRTLYGAQVQTRQVVDDYRRLQERAASTSDLLDALTDPRVTRHELSGSGDERLRAFVDLERRSLTLTVAGLQPVPDEQLALYWQQGDQWSLLGPLERRIAEGGGGRRYELPEDAALPARLALSREPRAALPKVPTTPLIQGELALP